MNRFCTCEAPEGFPHMDTCRLKYMKHERRVVGHVSGWQEQMQTCVCGNPWPCELAPAVKAAVAPGALS